MNDVDGICIAELSLDTGMKSVEMRRQYTVHVCMGVRRGCSDVISVQAM